MKIELGSSTVEVDDLLAERLLSVRGGWGVRRGEPVNRVTTGNVKLGLLTAEEVNHQYGLRQLVYRLIMGEFPPKGWAIRMKSADQTDYRFENLTLIDPAERVSAMLAVTPAADPDKGIFENKWGTFRVSVYNPLTQLVQPVASAKTREQARELRRQFLSGERPIPIPQKRLMTPSHSSPEREATDRSVVSSSHLTAGFMGMEHDDFEMQTETFDDQLAECTYLAHAEALDYKDFQGDPMPVWVDLPLILRRAWWAAAHAARNA